MYTSYKELMFMEAESMFQSKIRRNSAPVRNSYEQLSNKTALIKICKWCTQIARVASICLARYLSKAKHLIAYHDVTTLLQITVPLLCCSNRHVYDKNIMIHKHFSMCPPRGYVTSYLH